MNSLQRDIQKGEVVVLRKEMFKPEYQDLKHRLFRVTGGFGMLVATRGTALYGRYLDTEYDENSGEREHGMDISKIETEQYQKEYKNEQV